MSAEVWFDGGMSMMFVGFALATALWFVLGIFLSLFVFMRRAVLG